ncbi:hypothetical protein D3C85_1385980 [compost metagenome]
MFFLAEALLGNQFAAVGVEFIQVEGGGRAEVLVDHFAVGRGEGHQQFVRRAGDFGHGFDVSAHAGLCAVGLSGAMLAGVSGVSRG